MKFLLYVKLAGCKQMGKQQKVLSRLHHLNSWFKVKNCAVNKEFLKLVTWKLAYPLQIVL